jgi:hypothetical protein
LKFSIGNLDTDDGDAKSRKMSTKSVRFSVGRRNKSETKRLPLDRRKVSYGLTALLEESRHRHRQREW